MHLEFMREAIRLSREALKSRRGGPFGAVVVRSGEIIASGGNEVTSTNDPTAHAEIVAIRAACHRLGTFQLQGCEIYSSCEPCPMCLGAVHWARLDRLWFAADRTDAASAGFDDDLLYRELVRPVGERRLPAAQLLRDEARAALNEWGQMEDRVRY